MIDYWLNKYEGKELELFRNYGNPYETISIRIQMDEQKLYVGDEEIEHGPDGGSSMRLLSFDKENTRQAFAVLSQCGNDPVEVLKAMLNETDRLAPFQKLCQENNIEYSNNLYFG